MTTKQAFYFSDGPYLQTLQGLHDALSTPEAFIKLLGTSRSGKSTLCEKLSKYLRRKGFRVIYFQAAIESPEMLRSMLSRELDLPESSNFPRLLEDAMRENDEKPLILIFDDAHLLTDITLLEIYRLAEVQVDSNRVLNIVLCGEPALEKRLLTNQEFKALLLSVSHRFVLEPMDGEALSQFFYKYAEKSGIPGLQLEPAAMSYFYKSCKGYPGPAQNMCRLMVQARLGQTEMLPIGRAELVKILKHADSNQVLPSGQTQDSNRFGALIPLAAVVAIASLGFIYQQLQGEGNPEETQLAANNIPQSIRPERAEPSAQSDAPDPQTAATSEQTPPNTPSPFAANEAATEEASLDAMAVVASDSVSSTEIESEVESQAGNRVATEAQQAPPPGAGVAIAEPVSDSSLALVTAQERGVDTTIIVQPEFESLDATEESEVQAEESEPVMATPEELNDEPVAIALSQDEVEATEVAEPEPIVTEPDGTTAMELAANEPVAPPETDDIADVAVQPAASDMTVAVAETLPADQESGGEPGLDLDPTTVDDDDIAILEDSVITWIEAWEEKDLEGYFASYHTDFIPRYQDTQADWRSNRRRVIGNADWIRLEMTDFEFIGVDAGMMEVHFWLRYESPTYNDDTQKKLLLLQEDGEWRIMEEINLQVRG